MELLLPAGDFQSGCYALDNGADAVYLGLHQFSARKNARNFSFDDLRRLKNFAVKHGKRLYITCNTLIKDSEIPELLQFLEKISYIQADAVIIQDFGVLHIVKTHFPHIPVHASTQMGVHTPDGAAMLQDLGISRAILSRELTLEEIVSIRKTCPQMELEIFIHGALCYGFSGACLASGILLGRSANRGECGQVCRTWFTMDTQGNAQKTADQVISQDGYFFSMKDLSIREEIGNLLNAGIHSVKIEGRMKGPEYAAETARFYRKLIDSKSAPENERLQAKPDDTAIRTIFSRQNTKGWTGRRVDPGTLTTPEYPGHIGVEAGTISSISHDGYTAAITVKTPLAVHDGLLLLLPNSGSESAYTIPKPVKFSLTSMLDNQGRRMVKAEPGMKVRIKLPEAAQSGLRLHKISDHAQNLPVINPNSIKPWKHPIALTCTVFDDRVTLHTASSELKIQHTEAHEIKTETANRPADFRALVMKQFGASGESLFTIDPNQFVLDNRSSHPDNHIFIPPSRLKTFRRNWFNALDDQFRSRDRYYYENQISYLNNMTMKTSPLPDRVRINPKHDSPFPFIVDPAEVVPKDIPEVDGYRYLPLAPVLLHNDRYFKKLDTLVDNIKTESPGSNIRIGLNNIGHFPWALNHLELEYFADVYLYCANSHSLAQFRDICPSLRNAYYWLEDFSYTTEAALERESGIYPTRMQFQQGESFALPLFISRTCFHKNLDSDRCSGCSRHLGPVRLTQKNRTYRLYTRNCLSYVFLDS